MCVCVVLLLSVFFNNNVLDKIDSHDDCCHTKANIALRREYVVHVLYIGDVCGEPSVDVNIPIKGGIDEFREMIRVLREEIERGILFCVEEPVFYLVFFSHELFVECNSVVAFIESCFVVVAWGELCVDIHDRLLCNCRGGIIKEVL